MRSSVSIQMITSSGIIDWLRFGFDEIFPNSFNFSRHHLRWSSFFIETTKLSLSSTLKTIIMTSQIPSSSNLFGRATWKNHFLTKIVTKKNKPKLRFLWELFEFSKNSIQKEFDYSFKLDYSLILHAIFEFWFKKKKKNFFQLSHSDSFFVCFFRFVFCCPNVEWWCPKR